LPDSSSLPFLEAVERGERPAGETGEVWRRLGEAEFQAPLEALPTAERDRLLETLASWLAHQRHTPAVAAELHVHPQTVRYRIGKLRELLGSLQTADGAFELELALPARGALQA
jgi:sugar diacid utilization regulator